jgi:hypothetical protein
MPVPEFIRTKESWVLPGHFATRSVTRSVASHMTCVFIEWKFFLFTKASSSSFGAYGIKMYGIIHT